MGSKSQGVHQSAKLEYKLTGFKTTHAFHLDGAPTASFPPRVVPLKCGVFLGGLQKKTMKPLIVNL